MAIAGALLLVLVVLVRPQEFVPALQSFPLLGSVCAFAALGIACDLSLGKQRVTSTPQLPWLGAFVTWCFVVTVGRLGLDGFGVAWDFVGLSAVFMLLVAYTAATLSRWRALAALLVALGVFLSCTSIHQSQQDSQCIVIDSSSIAGEHSGEGAPDGRACEDVWTCERTGRPNTVYACEKVGLFGTFTEGRRARWRGTLGDPNELALALGAIVPFCFAFAASAHRRKRAALLAAIAVGCALWSIVVTGSRGGQLVILTVLGVYFVRRYGFPGAVLGALVASPVLLFGGRAGEEADASALERIGLLYEGIDIIRDHPLLGVGTGQFMDYAYGGLTAHNSYVLAAAELGLPGSLLWTMLVYTSVKIPWIVAFRPPPGLDGARFQPFALALVVAFAGTLVGVFFLSFCYKAMLFVYFGLAGALYRAARRACPGFDVRVSVREVASVAMADVAVLALVLVYSHLKAAQS